MNNDQAQPDQAQPYVIVGASLAGAKAAESLRENGFTGRIVLVGAEPELPYERPPLSKEYLLGRTQKTDAYVQNEQWYEENAVELVLDRRVESIDRAAHQLQLADGDPIGYQKLLLATGASPRRLKIAGNKLDGVRYLRRMKHSEQLRDDLRAGGRVVVVGAGWIGMETAAAAREYGCEVTVIDPESTPLRGTLGAEIGGFFADVHRKHGVSLRLGESVTEFRGDGRVSAVVTDRGEQVPADTVIVGIGARPNVELAEQSGLAVDDGVLVDSSLRTEDPDIYAAGDVASAFHPFYEQRVRVEHWANALHQGPAAARAMLGMRVDFDRLPYFFTDQYDVGMEFTGWLPPGGYDAVVTRGDVDSGAFHAFWLVDERVVAGMHVNLWDDGVTPARDLILSRARVDAQQLADTSIPLPEQASA